MSHPGWIDLLEWLAAHGMDISPQKLKVEARVTPHAGYGLFALQAIPPSASIFTIPAKALLNISTLSPHYPPTRPPLTAVQLLSLHLLRFRPKPFQRSMDPLFGPYISVLPNNFDLHPLTWLWKKRKHKFGNDPHLHFLNDVPPSVFFSLNHIFDQFQSDWETICQYLNKYRNKFLQGFELSESDFLWAWLNVNTRCVYHRLASSQSHPDNLTLCPILDFANHTTGERCMTVRPYIHEGFRNKIGSNFTLFAPSSSVTQEGDELYLMYGAHPNRKLFVDYGFVNCASDSEGEVDIQEPIQTLFSGRGQLGEWMKQQLVDHGYWGNWTLHLYPLPAHPSYRIIMALRLYHIFSPSTNEVPSNVGVKIMPWIRVLQGKQDSVSEENEHAWRETLLELCHRLISCANIAITKALRDDNDNGAEWTKEIRNTIKVLWEEELRVAAAVSESIRQGVQF